LYKVIKKTLVSGFAVLLLLGLLTGCADTAGSADPGKNTLYQVSTLNTLMLGYYDGVISCGELLSHGDTGIGTFDTLNGEMIVLDGKVYRAGEDGSVAPVDGSVTTPFAQIAFLDEDFVLDDLNQIEDIDALKTRLTEGVLNQTGNANLFYMAKITGVFKQVLVRSEAGQSKPYAPLEEVLKNQKEYAYENLSGTAVALYCPEYMNGLGLAGWHFHFISDDHSKGGHMLDASLDSARAQIGLISNFNMLLPQDKDFADLKLSQNLTEKTGAVEEK
jgi:acetolactate decarboxylase